MNRSGDGEALLFGVHPVGEAVRHRPRAIERIFVAREKQGGPVGRLLKEARISGIPVSYLPKAALARRVGSRAAHQGIAAVTSAMTYAGVSDVLGVARAADRPILLALDGVEDPGNLGAVLRTAAGAGVVGVLLGRDSTVGLTPAVLKASAGLAEVVPVARDPDLGKTLAALRNRGFDVVALEPRADLAWDEAELGGPVVLVAGGERKGIRPGLMRHCNLSVSIPLRRSADSLNLSVAVAVVVFEAVRRRRGGDAPRKVGTGLDRSRERC